MNMGVMLPVYIPGEDESPMRSMLEVPVYNVRGYEGAMTFGSITVTTMKTKHPVPCRALKFECDGKVLVYTGDAAEGKAVARKGAAHERKARRAAGERRRRQTAFDHPSAALQRASAFAG